jgi:hypothetical protein
MIEPEVKAELEKLQELLSPRLVTGSDGLPATTLVRWGADEQNRIWLGAVLGHPTFQLAVAAVLELRKPVWKGSADGADAMANGYRMEGFHDFHEQLRFLCLPAAEDHGRLRDYSDAEVLADMIEHGQGPPNFKSPTQAESQQLEPDA